MDSDCKQGSRVNVERVYSRAKMRFGECIGLKLKNFGCSS